MIVIPMAGMSSRFYKAGYTQPKFKLPLNNRTVFEEAINSFKQYFESDFFLFITRTDDESFDFVDEKCKILGIRNFKIVSIDFNTKGQADTISVGLNQIIFEIKNNEPLYIFNIDSIRLNFRKPDSKFLENVYGYLEVFEGEGEHWSFVDPLPNNLVKRTTEKVRISNLCSNGLYYFKTIELFKTAFKKMSLVNEYKELFVAPMYNFLIDEKKVVKYVKVHPDETLFSGVPQEYEELCKFFNSKKK